VTEPPQQRDLNLLKPNFRERLERWLTAARAAAAPLTIGIHETLRTPERQAWLWAQGRTRPGPKVTWTQHSKHQDGLAADFHLIKNGAAVWDAPIYEALHRAVPPENFGLRTLPGDLVHLELADDTLPVEPERLLITLDATGAEVSRVALPPGADVLLRATSDGSRVYVRPDQP